MSNLDYSIVDTEHFKYSEAIHSNYGYKRRIDNNIYNQEYLSNLHYLFEHLESIRNHFNKPIIITSCYRSPNLNRAVGGSRTSFHSIACAADFHIDTINLYDIFKWIYETQPFTELIFEEAQWIHYAIQKGRENEKQLKYKLPKHPVVRDTFENITKIFQDLKMI